ncbi:glyceraldehyde-3-phosphate dehydrogenase [Confluentibacter flavum]|uniref:Glyceraldehyde-3-phosphate dehydrogenase n=1 Tax=Confluentibacter flavum TaxID=1909700 RepID=A0A2N3HH00_9FLAO|nr:glyceraldehyde-3-phosphate dehydrogenase [Confluentibacter flavum]PKQ44193.1 glyceraldehyde-3-phosphate dehydrogenase [Confluentibacter flavum]
MNTHPYEKQLLVHTNRMKATIEFIKIVNDLYYDKSVELVFFRNQLMDKNSSQILGLHEYAKKFLEKPLSIYDSLEIAKAIVVYGLPPAKLDIGKLAYEFNLENTKASNPLGFLIDKFGTGNPMEPIKPRDVVLYGFGRIGRLVARILMANIGGGTQLRLRAIVTRDALDANILEKRAALLRNDSIHGQFMGTVIADTKNKALIINGTTVQMITSKSPEDIDYTKYGIEKALVIDNTGVFRDKETLERHFNAIGVDKVVLTAPGKGIPNIVYGINHLGNDVNKINVFSAASCTTNAITPILKVVEDVYGIENGHVETIHAYTNDQNLVDNFHSKYRRGRAAALNMVITETGAGEAASKVLPSLTGKLTSNAIRVPVPNGSLAILNLELKKATTLETMNATIKKAALDGALVEQIKYELSDELVSSDIVGCSAPSIYDSKATIVRKDGKHAILYVWYDNEYGYSHQVIRLAKYIAKVRRFTYY